jgi:hypothetical protein
MSIIVNILATLGLIGILVVVIYYIWKYIDKMNKNAAIAKERPTPTYMEQVGLKCPDYWVYKDNDANGNYICEDSNKLMVQYDKNKDAKCVNSTTNQVVFSKFDSKTPWAEMNDEERIKFTASKVGSGYSRAEWIKKCGPNVGRGVSTRAIWSGLEKYV